MRNQICLDILAYKSLCTIKTSCKFNSLKHPPHKQSMHLIELQKWLVWIRGARWHHLGTNICINTPPEQVINIGPAHWCSVANRCHVITLNASESNINHYLVCTGYSKQIWVCRQHKCSERWFGLNSSFTSLYRYQKDPSVRNKWIVYFNGNRGTESWRKMKQN